MAKNTPKREEESKEMGKPQVLVLFLVLYLTTNSREREREKEIVILHNIYFYVYIFFQTRLIDCFEKKELLSITRIIILPSIFFFSINWFLFTYGNKKKDFVLTEIERRFDHV